MRRRTGLFLAAGLAVFLCLAQASGHAQMRGNATDEQIVREARLVASGARVEIFQHELSVSPALLTAAEQALNRMEEILGRTLDHATLGAKIRIYASASTTISHVWRGYEHPADPKGVLFLNPAVTEQALTGRNATYAHELAHLLTWRFSSHTLREGLADYLALQLHPGAGVGPNVNGYAVPPPVPPEVEEYIGTSRASPYALANDMRFRRAYYFASYRFVRYLIATAGMPVFLQLYDALDPEREYVRLYGKTRQELVAASRL